MTHEALNIEQYKAPLRQPNGMYRDREFLLKHEVDTLLEKCNKKTRNRLRDYCIILLGYKHGLRAIEFTWLKWESIDLNRATIFIKRAKGSDSGTHHLTGIELRKLRELKRNQPIGQVYVFTQENHSPMASTAISTMIKRLGENSDKTYTLGFPVHAHMLRHTTGYLMVEAGIDIRIIQSWLGHREIQNTTKYTKLGSSAFNGIDI